MTKRLWAAALMAVLCGTAAWGQEGAAEEAAPTQTFGELPAAATQPAVEDWAGDDAAATQSEGEAPPERVIEELMAGRPESPVIDPSGSSIDVAPLSAAGPDPAVMGVAPGQAQPTLYREGEFLVSRRGRMQRLASGHLVFQLEADAQASPEGPLLLMPCQLLENMEELTRQRGERTVFVLSGQVFTYHGQNWLLPSMMKLDVERENLQK